MKTKILGYISFILLFLMSALPLIYLSNFKPKIREDTLTNTYISKPTIIIDAGHGGEDGGAVGVDGLLEKDINLEISFLLRDMLLAAGQDVVLTRSEDILLYDRSTDYKGRKKALDLAARVRIAENYKNSIFISIHMNSFPDGRYSGLQVYYSKNDPASKTLADTVQSVISNKLQKDNNRKTKPAGSNIFVLDRLRSPAILIECGFLSNSEECKLLRSEKYKQKLALSISIAIMKYISTTT